MSTEEKKTDNNDSENKPMSLSRRRFCQLAGATVAAVALGRYVGFDPASPAAAFYQSTGLAKFIMPLRGVGPGGIPVAASDGPTGVNGAAHYTIDINEYQDTLHSGLGGPTTLWGYNPRTPLGGGVQPQKHLGAIIVAERGVPIQITFQNNLPSNHILPIDSTIMGVVPGHHNRTAVHLHGGLVPWISDGGPFSWFENARTSADTINGDYGPSVPAGPEGNIFKNLNSDLLPGQAEFYYPNNQSARMEWYHDHAIGLTRLNAYAGIASAYIIRDNFERGLKSSGLPEFVELGGNEIPLVFQDKIFIGVGFSDPLWTGSVSSQGSLWYPHVYESRWGSDPASKFPLPPLSSIPEMFGDTMLVNGVVHPFKSVEPRRYRLRILNACQARFLNLQLYEDDGTGEPILTSRGPDFLVIGTEGGFLANPVLVPSNRTLNYVNTTDVDPANPGGSLLTAPAERWDVIVDFGEKDSFGNLIFAGKKFILYNDAPAPFPGGDPLNNYNNPGPGLNTRKIMRFEVATTGIDINTLGITPSTDLKPGIDTFLVALTYPVDPVDPFNVIDSGGNVTIPVDRKLTLNEIFDQYGRLVQMLGTNQRVNKPMNFTMDPLTPDAPFNYAREYVDMTNAPSITETPASGHVEVWQIANLTMDTHPMHFHLVNVQVLARQTMAQDSNGLPIYVNGVPNYGTNIARGPGATELGWKETIKMAPGEVTTIIMKFDLPSGLPFSVPESPRTGGHEYVWHCHILEHEEHDMMRPLVVMDSPTPPPPPVPELPTAILTAVGTVAALGLAGKMKKENKDDEKE